MEFFSIVRSWGFAKVLRNTLLLRHFTALKLEDPSIVRSWGFVKFLTIPLLEIFSNFSTLKRCRFTAVKYQIMGKNVNGKNFQVLVGKNWKWKSLEKSRRWRRAQTIPHSANFVNVQIAQTFISNSFVQFVQTFFYNKRGLFPIPIILLFEMVVNPFLVEVTVFPYCVFPYCGNCFARY